MTGQQLEPDAVQHPGYRGLLILSTVCFSWLAMQVVHEAGHALVAIVSGGQIEQIVLSPWTISRTDLSKNPAPLQVAWGGPLLGVAIPLALTLLSRLVARRFLYLARFFAGFCLVANGAYLAFGWIGPVGDAQTLLQHGAQVWQLMAFGLPAIVAGLALWHGQGRDFGLSAQAPAVDRGAAIALTAATIALILIESLFSLC